MNPTLASEHIDGPRACRPYELAPTLDVGTAVMRLERDVPPTWGHSWPHVYCPENLDNIRIIKVNDQVVSSMGIFTTSVRAYTAQAAEITLTVGGINGVATLSPFRRRGLAGQLLQDCHAKMRADGCDIALLSTGIDNWYRRFGWENGAQQWTFTIDRGSSSYLPPLDEALVMAEVTTTMSALSEVGTLHRAASLGSQRRAELDTLLFTRLGSRIFVARQDSRIMAYVVVRDNQVLEHGGPPATIAGLVRTLFEGTDDPALSTSGRNENDVPWTLRMTIHTPPVDDGMSHFLYNLGVPHSRTYLGMIRIINAQQLLHKIAPRFVFQEETEEEILVRDGTSQHQIDRREMVKWLFGPERLPSFADAGLPVTFYQWPLDWV